MDLEDEQEDEGIDQKKINEFLNKIWKFTLVDIMLLLLIGGLFGALYGLEYGQAWCNSKMEETVKDYCGDLLQRKSGGHFNYNISMETENADTTGYTDSDG